MRANEMVAHPVAPTMVDMVRAAKAHSISDAVVMDAAGANWAGLSAHSDYAIERMIGTATTIRSAIHNVRKAL